MKSFNRRATALFLGVLGLSLLPAAVPAQTFISGSTGADGAFNPTCTPTPCTVSVQLPTSGIFNFTTVAVPTNVTVKFIRNLANTPVTVLATGDVAVAGTIDVSGTGGVLGIPGRGGPGGFDGGLGGSGFGATTNGSPGLGPGGGQGGAPGVGTRQGSASEGGFGAQGTSNGAAVPGGPAYGVHTLFPLIGGSGGGGGAGGPTSSGPAGGGGGGAILIASSGTITVTGFVLANGGDGVQRSVGLPSNVFSGCGSGGGIRLIGNTINMTGLSGGRVQTVGGNGSCFTAGAGRIRIEAFQVGTLSTSPVNPSQGLPGPVLPGANSPAVQIVSIGGVSVPPTPQASYFNVPDVTVNPNLPNPITVALQANNVPLGSVIAVSVVTEGVATRSIFNSTALAGTLAASTATANVTLPVGTSVLTATATFAAP
jgi:hypothetical protein